MDASAALLSEQGAQPSAPDWPGGPVAASAAGRSREDVILELLIRLSDRVTAIEERGQRPQPSPEARSTAAAPAPRVQRAPTTPRGAVGSRLPTVAAALADVGVRAEVLPSLPAASVPLSVPMEVPAERKDEVAQAARALAAQQNLLGQDPERDDEVSFDADPVEALAVQAALATQQHVPPSVAALRAMWPHEPRDSQFLAVLSGQVAPVVKFPPHPVWGVPWLPQVAALPDLAAPVRAMRARSKNTRNIEEATVLFAALHHFREGNWPALGELLARRAVGLLKVDEGKMSWDLLTAITSVRGLALEPSAVEPPVEAMRALQLHVNALAALQKGVPVMAQGPGARRDRRERGGGQRGQQGQLRGGAALPQQGSKPAASGGSFSSGRAASAPSDRQGQ